MPANASAGAGHVVLLGDSVFDNAAYVAGGPDVVTQVRGLLPRGWHATLLAVDGDVISGVAGQLRSLPRNATHLVISVGGNDALGFAYLLNEPVRSAAQAFAKFADAQDGFAAAYAAMLEAVAARGLPAAACTIYDTPPSAPDQRIIRSAAALFNDRITREVFTRGMSLVDLRLVCSEDGDYANPIEPSVQGGHKIAGAIRAFLFPANVAPRSMVIGA
ncbi:MAG: GDSL-type esterase/lipase family protein [Actinomycetota bacterium]